MSFIGFALLIGLRSGPVEKRSDEPQDRRAQQRNSRHGAENLERRDFFT